MTKREIKRATHFRIAFTLYSAFMDGVEDTDREIWLASIDRHLAKAGKTYNDFKPVEGIHNVASVL